MTFALPESRASYAALRDRLSASGDPALVREATRQMARGDLYFLLRYVLNATYADNDWCFNRCREVQLAPDGRLDLWAREHFKSTIITFALTIQDILRDPETTVGLFSHTRPIAKAFLRQIKREFEANETLKGLFPDILWANPRKEAPKWSEDEGIVVKRKTNPKEATIEAWGLVDGQPTSKHFGVLVYDDVVTRESVTTPEMIKKTTDAWALSLNLGKAGGVQRIIGTRYHLFDTYRTIIERGAAIPRQHAATVDGTPEGETVYLPREALEKKLAAMGSYVFGAQMLLNPIADRTMGFMAEWLRHYPGELNWQPMNRMILVDPASSKKQSADYTSVWVLGLASDNNVYVIDMYRDRLSLTERADLVFDLHRTYSPRFVGYEKYGMMGDIEHMQDRMARETYRFSITELGGTQPKPDRIRRLVPWFEQGRIWLPSSLMRVGSEGKAANMVETFIRSEYAAFPVVNHDDMLDSLSRICDDIVPMIFPKPVPTTGRVRRGHRRTTGHNDPMAA